MIPERPVPLAALLHKCRAVVPKLNCRFFSRFALRPTGKERGCRRRSVSSAAAERLGCPSARGTKKRRSRNVPFHTPARVKSRNLPRFFPCTSKDGRSIIFPALRGYSVVYGECAPYAGGGALARPVPALHFLLCLAISIIQISSKFNHFLQSEPVCGVTLLPLGRPGRLLRPQGSGLAIKASGNAGTKRVSALRFRKFLSRGAEFHN